MVIGLIVFTTIILDILLYSYQFKTTTVPKKQWWFSSKPVEQIRDEMSFWHWVFIVASMVCINLTTLLLFLFDMKQILKSGYRVSKSLMVLTLMCGGWLISPSLFFTEYLRMNDINVKKFAIFLCKISVVSITSLSIVLVTLNLLV